jgi:hypothetical protein
MTRREWAGIAMLALAILISATFLDAGAGDVPPARTPVLGTPLPPTVATPYVAPTPTPQPPGELDTPEGAWLVEYFSLPGNVREAANAVDTLDLAFDAAPFGDLHDDSWMLVASHDIEAPAGPRQFTIDYDGEVTIYLDDAQILSANDPSQNRPLTVIFEHPGGSARLRIELRDTAGPLALRWSDD